MMNQRMNIAGDPTGRGGRATRRAFSLIEALVASTLLGMIVLAVISAVTSAQSLSFEGQKQILAAMAADDYMTELMTLDYEDRALLNGSEQPVGEMETLDAAPYPDTVWALGRRVGVTEVTIVEPGLGIEVTGQRVVVEAFDEFRALATLETFVPEPAL